MSEKPTRRTRAELREMMLTAGKDVLFRIEPSLGFEELTYSAVFDHLQANYGQKVTIGSVHERIWKSQREFQLDVIAQILRAPIEPAVNDRWDQVSKMIAPLDLSTLATRRYALQTSVRLSSRQVFQEPLAREINLAHIVRFRLWALGPDNPEASGFTEAIRDIRTTSTAAFADLFRSMMDIIGIRVRAGTGDPDQVIEDVAIMGNAFTLALQTDVLPQTSMVRELPTGLDGENEDWYLDSIAMWAYVRSAFEFSDEGLTDDERRL